MVVLCLVQRDTNVSVRMIYDIRYTREVLLETPPCLHICLDVSNSYVILVEVSL